MIQDSAETRSLAAERREQIAAACLDEIADLGFQHVTMSSIAQRVGLTRAALYSHFDCRDELIEFAIADEMSHILGELSVLVDGGTSAQDVVVEVFAYMYRRLRDHPVMHQLLGAERVRMMSHLRGDTPETIMVVHAVLADELRLLSDRTTTRIDEEAGAEFMVRLWLSLLVSPQLGPDLSQDGVVEGIARRWLLPGMFI
ncbi:TetR/AcrR family transcriptional regulator [Aeromicrobium sp.]|uniref:TetR/AcrR family transcriptional regulator n=1 Tax=Aeromicrobium sp. TaxID=1871063 RepID=UPI0030BB88FC